MKTKIGEAFHKTTCSPIWFLPYSRIFSESRPYLTNPVTEPVPTVHVEVSYILGSVPCAISNVLNNNKG